MMNMFFDHFGQTVSNNQIYVIEKIWLRSDWFETKRGKVMQVLENIPSFVTKPFGINKPSPPSPLLLS